MKRPSDKAIVAALRGMLIDTLAALSNEAAVRAATNLAEGFTVRAARAGGAQ